VQTNYHLRRKQLDTPQMRTRSNGEEIPCHHQANEHDSCSHKSKAELVSKRCPFCFRERRHIFHVRPHAVRPEISDDLCVLRLSTFVRIHCSVTSWFRCHSLQSGAPADNAHALPDHSFMDSTASYKTHPTKTRLPIFGRFARKSFHCCASISRPSSSPSVNGSRTALGRWLSCAPSVFHLTVYGNA